MSGMSYLSTGRFNELRDAALDAFRSALAYRLQERAVDAIMRNEPLSMVLQPDGDRQRSPLGSSSAAPVWSYSSWEARAHVDPGFCRYLGLVRDGQPDQLERVRCDGATARTWPNPQGGGTYVPVSPTINCGVWMVLRQVADWAWVEGASVRARLPALDHHDLSLLDATFEDLAKTADRLDVYQGGRDVLEGAQPAGAGDMREVVSAISASIGEGKGWRIDWTGLAAQRAASFLDSTKPTMSNQCHIAKAMAKLCSDRAAIIEKGRRDSLAWLDWAVTCLQETERVSDEPLSGWFGVQAIGQGAAVTAAVNPAVGAAGATIALVGFLGDNLTPDTREVAHAHEVEDVVTGLHQGIDTLHTELDGHENEYWRAATRLSDWIHGTHSYNLELYDLTRNDPTGSGRGFSVDVDEVLWLATRCHQMGSGYEELRPTLARTSQADRHLAGADGRPTAGDTTLLEIRDLLESFLRTTAARYHIAADQLESAARAYAATDADAQQDLNNAMRQGRDPIPPADSYRVQEGDATERKSRFYLHTLFDRQIGPEGTGVYREPGWAQPDHGYVTEDD